MLVPDAPVNGRFPPPLAEHGDRAALLTETGAITYTELEHRVALAAERLGPRRRLVALAGANHPDAVVLYLAALRGGHPLILVDAEHDAALSRIVDAYDPDVIARRTPDDAESWTIDERRARSRHELHPELALLLSTSGSTGSPKLVRLSHANLRTNADAIVSYLAITPADRAITSLPMAYSYGLSVINSHLLRGASVVLTRRSVIEPEFWNLMRSTRGTSFAGVPYTFDLLDRVGFEEMDLPHLRYITQAGGRLDPRTVRRYVALGERGGWDLYVMYGQTEATARMTYLPPDVAAARSDSIGLPIPGGSLRLDPVPDAPPGAGELVYRGPNVMLGYAGGPSDLSLGRTVDELRTGDLARRGDDGLYEIVGRRAQFLKIAGLRVDLRAVEHLAERQGGRACAVGSDEQLVVFVEQGAPADLLPRIRETIGLPANTVRVETVTELPRLPNGKLDRAEMLERATRASRTELPAGGTGAVRDLYAMSLGLDEITVDDTFSGLGGDSLSYVEVSLGLEEILGHLPDGWATMPIGRLAALAQGEPVARRWTAWLGRWRSVEMSVALRAMAILLVVATHIGMVSAAGGAHVLMAVAGFNFARFRLTDAERQDRVRSQLRAVARIAIPAMGWVALAILLLDQYELRHLLLVNALVHDQLWGNLWFIELLVYISLAMAVLLAVPAIDRAERRWPFGAALAVLAVGLLGRFEVLDVGIPYTMPVLWLFALGWAASRAHRTWQRGLVVVIALVSIPGYFDSWERNAVILAGVLLLIGVPKISVPAPLARAAGVLAAASLYIYLVHWEVWPIFTGWYGLTSLAASLATGIAVWWAAERTPRTVATVRTAVRELASTGGAPFQSAAEGRPR